MGTTESSNSNALTPLIGARVSRHLKLQIIKYLPFELQIKILSMMPLRYAILLISYPELRDAVSTLVSEGVVIAPDTVSLMKLQHKRLRGMKYPRGTKKESRQSFDNLCMHLVGPKMVNNTWNRNTLQNSEIQVGTVAFHLLRKFFGSGPFKLSFVHISIAVEYTEVESILKSTRYISCDLRLFTQLGAKRMPLTISGKIKKLTGDMVPMSSPMLKKLKNIQEIKTHAFDPSVKKFASWLQLTSQDSVKKVHVKYRAKEVNIQLLNCITRPTVEKTYDLLIQPVPEADEFGQFVTFSNSLGIENLISLDYRLPWAWRDTMTPHIIPLSNFSNLAKLSIHGYKHTVWLPLILSCHTLINLVSLTVSRCILLPNDFKISNCKRLKRLLFMHCLIGPPLMPEQFWVESQFINPSTPNSLSSITSESEKDLVLPRSLKSIKFDECGFRSLPDKLLQNLDQLETLSINNCFLRRENQFATPSRSSVMVGIYLYINDKILPNVLLSELTNSEVILFHSDYSIPSPKNEHDPTTVQGAEIVKIVSDDEEDDEHDDMDIGAEDEGNEPIFDDIVDSRLFQGDLPLDGFNDESLFKKRPQLILFNPISRDQRITRDSISLKQRYLKSKNSYEFESKRYAQHFPVVGSSYIYIPSTLFERCKLLTELIIRDTKTCGLPNLEKMPFLRRLVIDVNSLTPSEGILDLDSPSLKELDLTVYYTLNIVKVNLPRGLSIFKLSTMLDPRLVYRGFLIRSNFSYLKKKVNKSLEFYYSQCKFVHTSDKLLENDASETFDSWRPQPVLITHRGR